jgi:ribose transport system substrate-binding protein
MRIRYRVFAVLSALCLALAFGLSACGGGGSSSGGSSSSGGDVSSGTTGPANSEGSGGSSAAAAAIKPYLGHPSPFPVTEPLKERPTGANVDFVDCGTPICALIGEFVEAAGGTIGMKMTHVKAGSAANTVSAAFDSVVTQNPSGVVASAINVELWQNQLKDLLAAETPIASTGIVNAEQYGLNPSFVGRPQSERDGALLADYVISEFGFDSNVVYYDVPELPFLTVQEEAFLAEMEKNCPECEVRTEKIPVATLGNTAPSQVVSDLQAHPETSAAVFGTDEIEAGLPAALETAGIEIKTLGYGPGPTQLQYLEEGKETAALAIDIPVFSWTLIDAVAREIGGEELKGDEAEGISDVQFLTQKDITFDPSKGWTGYPDFEERFEKLWGVGG